MTPPPRRPTKKARSPLLAAQEDILVRQLRDLRATGRRIEQQDLDQALASLPARQQQAMRHVYWDGLSVASAAREMGIDRKSAVDLLEGGRVNLLAYLTRANKN